MTGAYFGTHEIITQLFSNDESKKINWKQLFPPIWISNSLEKWNFDFLNKT
jgi:hypothetical protein